MYCSAKYLVGVKSSLICKALLKYDYSIFSFGILEYSDAADVIAREQYYIDTLNPEYNLCKVAGSSLGLKRSKETKEKIAVSRLGRKLSEETKTKIAAAILGRKHSDESLAKMKGRKFSEETLTKIRDHLVKLNKSKGIPVEVLDLETNISTEFDSIRLAAQGLNASPAAPFGG